MLAFRRYLHSCLLLAAVCLMLAPLQASRPPLSPSARISLVTVEGGRPLYTAFGHSALRVRDASIPIDLVFNYGTFDFNAPGFYTNFMQGHMTYFLAVSDFSRFIYWNTEDGRYTCEQELLLDAGQRQRLFDALLINAEPENRDYAYDFFYDNCATRIRDMLQTVFGDSLVFADRPSDGTLRDLLHGCLGRHPWSRLGLDIILGLPCDSLATARTRMFLPGCLSDAFADARLQGRPLAASPVALNNLSPKPLRHPYVTVPTICAWLLLAAGVLCFRKGKARAIFDRCLFAFVGIAGMIVAYMWFLSAHTATHWNLNLLWALPTHLVIAFCLSGRRPALWRLWYFRLTSVLCIFLLAAWPWLPQAMHAAVIPLTLLLLCRSWARTGWPASRFIAMPEE